MLIRFNFVIMYIVYLCSLRLYILFLYPSASILSVDSNNK